MLLQELEKIVQTQELSSANSEDTKFDDIIKLIKKNCKPFLKEMEGRFVYRGSKTSDIIFFPHPKKRPPLDTDGAFNFIFNAMFQESFGIEDVRTRTIFASHIQANAKNYGLLHFFFPIGEIEYSWGKSISDSAGVFMPRIDLSVDKTLGAELNGTEFWNLSSVMKPSEWVKGIQQNAKGIIDLTMDTFETEDKDFPKHLLERMGYHFKQYYNINTGLSDARGAELMFFKTDGYYLLSEKLINEHLGITHSSMETLTEYLTKKLL